MIKKHTTKADEAAAAAAVALNIQLKTIDAQIYALAEKAYSAASAAAGHLENASYFDSRSGGGSGNAWACRSRAARHMKKARALLRQIRTAGEATAEHGKPSLADILFLLRVEAGAGEYPALMAEHNESGRSAYLGWIVLVGNDRDVRWALTATGQDTLNCHRQIVAGMASPPRKD